MNMTNGISDYGLDIILHETRVELNQLKAFIVPANELRPKLLTIVCTRSKQLTVLHLVIC